MQTKCTFYFLLLFLFNYSTNLCSQGTFDYGISTMDKVTGISSVLIDLPGTGEYNPAWSPDGTLIAFDVVSPIDPHRIGVANSSGSLITIFSGSSDGSNNASWNAAGTMLAVDKVPNGDNAIYTIDVGSGVTTLLVADAVDPAFSNKGGSKQFIAFSRPSDGNIYIMKMSTGIINMITPGENPKWSPNDKALVYSLGGDVFTIDISKSGTAAGAAIIQAGDPLYIESRPAWVSPNEIIFHSDYSGDFDIYKKRLRGSTTINRVGGTVGDGDFDPDYDNNSGLIAFAGAPIPVAPLIVNTVIVNKPGIYPNPVRNILNINLQLDENDDVNLRMYNVNGSVVFNQDLGKLYKGNNFKTVSIPDDLMPGSYFIRITGKQEYISKQVIVAK